MLPIINRKYPVLEVVEVDRDTPPERLTTVTDHWVVRAYPIFPNEVRVVSRMPPKKRSSLTDLEYHTPGYSRAIKY